jgi:hypothetical protein
MGIPQQADGAVTAARGVDKYIATCIPRQWFMAMPKQAGLVTIEAEIDAAFHFRGQGHSHLALNDPQVTVAEPEPGE